MQNKPIKKSFLLTMIFLLTIVCNANRSETVDGNNTISIKAGVTQGNPKTSSIQATINGHYLTVVFTENLGQVTVEVSKVSGGETQFESTPTPNGVNFYIYDTGSYIVTFYLSNGDEYYGEFEVTD